MAKEQVYCANGEQLGGVAIEREQFKHNAVYLHGTVHIWVWRRTGSGEVEVLVQKRSQSKKNNPGKFDASAAGHIDENESPIVAAVREPSEEIGVTVNPDKLLFVMKLRKTNVHNIIATVYLYEVDETFEAVFNDGEVDEVSWKSLTEFEEMTQNPERCNLVSHGEEYFRVLLAHLQQI